MRLSRFFLPILKETPKEAEIVSHRYMLRAGMVRQQSAGIYSWLPLGLRVLRKIERIVEEEQARAGAVQLLMPTIQSADLWRESGRYDAYGREMLRITDRHDREMLFGPTNEEMITEIFRAYVHSYKSLPLNLYHIQWKFRDEVRPRFGVMRGREFLMKDAYSFDVDKEGARHAYNRMFVAYLRTFDADGPPGHPDAGGHRADRRRHEPRIHHPGLRPARARSSATRPGSRPADHRREDTDFEADLTPIDRYLDQTLRGNRRDARRRPPTRRLPEEAPRVGARHRGRAHLLLRHEVLRTP
jgi:prolyl-tRNA synthetase